MFEKKAETQIPVDDIIARRWSGRAYDPDRAVPREALIALLEAARWAPSCFGDQPWRLVVLDRCADEAAWQRGQNCLVEGNRAWAKAAPVLILVLADSQFGDGRPNRWGGYDTGAAVMSLALEATARGLMIHQMGGFDGAKARAEFEVPERYEPMAMISLGYQLPEDRIPEELKSREYAPRSRRPLPESFFAGRFGKSFA